MSQGTEQMKKDLQTGRDQLRTLRDEIRVKLHLAGMDARETFSKLEAEAIEIERGVTEASRLALADVVDRFKKLSSSIKSKA